MKTRPAALGEESRQAETSLRSSAAGRNVQVKYYII